MGGILTLCLLLFPGIWRVMNKDFLSDDSDHDDDVNDDNNKNHHFLIFLLHFLLFLYSLYCLQTLRGWLVCRTCCPLKNKSFPLLYWYNDSKKIYCIHIRMSKGNTVNPSLCLRQLWKAKDYNWSYISNKILIQTV